MRELLIAAAVRAIRYLEGLNERSVTPDPAVVARLAELDVHLPTDPSPADETMALLDSFSAATMAMAGPRFFGFVIGGVLPAALAANWLASAWDQNAALAEVTPLPAKLEDVALRWLRDVLGLPSETRVGFVTGATMANFTCLTAARHSALKHAGWDVEADGMFGAPPVTVVVGEEAHPTLFKSLGLAGFGRNRVVRVPVDKQGRIRADQFPNLSGPTVVCLKAGNVNSGAFDPASDIIPKAKAANAWVHVDGSYTGEHRDAFASSRSTPRHSNAVSIVHFSLAKNLTGDVLTFEVRERQRIGGCISSLIAQQEDLARTVSQKLCKSQ